jgi:hypothetical protein
VGSHRRELDVHRLQQTPDTIDHAVAVLLHVHPHARQLAQLPDRFGRNETTAQQPVLQVFGNAAGIDAIRLAALQGAHHRRIHQGQLESMLAAFQHIPDRYPVNTGRLHGDLFDFALAQPLAQTQQILGERSENCLFHLAIRLATNTSPDTNAD